MDEGGEGYIVGADSLACRLSGAQRLPALGPTLRRLGWVAAPAAAPCTRTGPPRLPVPAA